MARSPSPSDTPAATSTHEEQRATATRSGSDATFLFADIAGFTALTEAHGDEDAADLVGRFCDAVRIELPASGGTLVKTIGDALMLRIPDPLAAVPVALHIANDVMHGHGDPSVRVGMHHGPAAERDGDYFGASVNLAARVSAVATAGEVVMTAQTAALAPALDGVIYEARGRQQFRNVSEPVELVAAVRFVQTANLRLTVDPVCQMTVDPDQASGRLAFQDATYFFCTLACAGAFAQHPERYARSTRAASSAA